MRIHPKPVAARLAKIGSADLRARWEEIVAGRFAEDKLADSNAKISQAAHRLETQLEGRDWLMGEFTIADLESYAWLAGMVALVPAAFEGASRTLAWLERVRARSAVARALSLASSGDPLKCWAPGPEINRWG